jgi:hypothetical protein
MSMATKVIKNVKSSAITSAVKILGALDGFLPKALIEA